MKKLIVIGLLTGLVGLTAFGCSSDGQEKSMSKDQAKSVAKADWPRDFCKQYGWYGDGICDDFCPSPDPDCSSDCTDASRVRVCGQDVDCRCGINVVTGNCDIGVAQCIDETHQCPDACTGIAGNLEIVCEQGQCVQRMRSRCDDKAEYRACETKADCACGTNVTTRECDFGVAACIDESRQCPDFCTGFGGNLEIACESGECVQRPRSSNCEDKAEYRACGTKEDCVCGTNIATQECDFGVAACIDETVLLCPDFCAGIGGNLEIVCEQGTCVQIKASICRDKTEYRICETKEDCFCGTNIVTQECDFGLEACIDESAQCPDYCTGIGGNLEIACDKGECVHRPKSSTCDNEAEYRACQTPEDCACGTNVETGDCDFGVAKCIDESRQCPDFCTGIGGHLKITCQDFVCVQVSR